MKLAAVLDFETTDIDPKKGKVIEGAVSLVEINEDRRFGEIVDSYSSFNDPGYPIPAEITALTGIDDAMVAGHQLDWEKFLALLKRSQVLISHNAIFDRGWLEVHGEYKTSWWACSLKMIDWSAAHRMPCRTLKHLAWEHDFFPNAHRAIDDVHTLVRLLKTPAKRDPSSTYGQELLNNAAIRRRIVLAAGAPFETKEWLKSAGFRWSGQRKVWWKVVGEPEMEKLLSSMTECVYSKRPGYIVSEPVDSLAPDFLTAHNLT